MARTVASANLLSLDNLVGGDGKRRGPEALADGTGIENGVGAGSTWTVDIERADSAEALEDLEHALVVAVHAGDQTSTKEILRILQSSSSQAEVRAPISRILWRAVMEEPDTKVGASDSTGADFMIPTSLLDFAFVDDINGRTGLHEVRL